MTQPSAEYRLNVVTLCKECERIVDETTQHMSQAKLDLNLKHMSPDKFFLESGGDNVYRMLTYTTSHCGSC